MINPPPPLLHGGGGPPIVACPNHFKTIRAQNHFSLRSSYGGFSLMNAPPPPPNPTQPNTLCCHCHYSVSSLFSSPITFFCTSSAAKPPSPPPKLTKS